MTPASPELQIRRPPGSGLQTQFCSARLEHSDIPNPPHIHPLQLITSLRSSEAAGLSRLGSASPPRGEKRQSLSCLPTRGLHLVKGQVLQTDTQILTVIGVLEERKGWYVSKRQGSERASQEKRDTELTVGATGVP